MHTSLRKKDKSVASRAVDGIADCRVQSDHKIATVAAAADRWRVLIAASPPRTIPMFPLQIPRTPHQEIIPNLRVFPSCCVADFSGVLDQSANSGVRAINDRDFDIGFLKLSHSFRKLCSFSYISFFMYGESWEVLQTFINYTYHKIMFDFHRTDDTWYERDQSTKVIDFL